MNALLRRFIARARELVGLNQVGQHSHQRSGGLRGEPQGRDGIDGEIARQFTFALDTGSNVSQDYRGNLPIGIGADNLAGENLLFVTSAPNPQLYRFSGGVFHQVSNRDLGRTNADLSQYNQMPAWPATPNKSGGRS